MTATATERPLTPTEAWTTLREGNDRFVADSPLHPSQGADRRREISAGQHPHTVIFGCSDSRVAAEIIFDQGLGDTFVVRTAGHVLDTTVIGSIEYGVEVLGTPLVVVLGHDSCGAVGAATAALADGDIQRGFVRAVVDRVIPSIVSLAHGADAEGRPRDLSSVDPAELGHEHVRHTVDMLRSYSVTLAEGIDAGRVAVVGVEYALADGHARLTSAIGDIGDVPVPA